MAVTIAIHKENNMELVNQEKFEKLLSENKYVVADFYADWCGPCKMLAPILEEVSGEFPQIAFCKVNVDESEKLAMKYNIDYIPNVNIFVDGVHKDRFVGLKSKQELVDLFNQLIG